MNNNQLYVLAEDVSFRMPVLEVKIKNLETANADMTAQLTSLAAQAAQNAENISRLEAEIAALNSKTATLEDSYESIISRLDELENPEEV